MAKNGRHFKVGVMSKTIFKEAGYSTVGIPLLHAAAISDGLSIQISFLSFSLARMHLLGSRYSSCTYVQ